MNSSMELFIHKITYALGWTLVHSLWQAAALFTLITLVLALPRNVSPGLRFGFHLCALYLLPIAGFTTFVNYYSAYDASLFWVQQGFMLPVQVIQQHGVVSWINNHISGFVLLWCVGFLVGLIRFTGAFVYCQNLINNSKMGYSKTLQDQIEKLAQTLAIAKPVLARISARVSVPCVIGHIKPVVLIPERLIGRLDMAQLEAILLHELAHVKRNDYLLGLIECLVKTLYFYNPFTHLLLKRIDAERENICDDIAVATLGDAMLYARSLEAIGQTTVKGDLTMALTANDHSLLNRVKRQFEKNALRQKNVTGLLSAASMFFAAMIFAVNAIGSDMPKIEYEGINALTNDQVAELIVLARDSIQEDRENNRGIRENVLDENPEFKKLSQVEREVFVSYLKDELWRYFNMDGWNLKLYGAPAEVEEQTRQALFDSDLASRVEYLKLGKGIKEYSYSRDSKVLFELLYYPSQKQYEISLSQVLVDEVKHQPDKWVEDGDFRIVYKDKRLQINLPLSDDAVNRAKTLGGGNSQRAISEEYPLDTPEAEQIKLRDARLSIGIWDNGITLSLDNMLLQRLQSGVARRVGNGFFGVEFLADRYLIPLDIERFYLNRNAMNAYFEYGKVSDDFGSKWAALEKRIEQLSESDKVLIPSDGDMDDLRLGLELGGTKVSDSKFKDVKYHVLSDIVRKIESGEDSIRQMVTSRPWYSSGENNQYYASRNFSPLPESETSFSLDLRHVPMDDIYRELKNYCPQLEEHWPLKDNFDLGTFVFKNLNCERVNAVLAHYYPDRAKSHDTTVSN
ncbi:BlaR1 peptidase M56 [Alteromonadaceae bacterium 2753L.S.0a.02]|nr:BlaR1 peptidase M56 [Alteromonadaceae bacterium 2753L.S.0a.02]